MLALKLVGGGASTIGSVALNTCGICIRKYAENIPHPSECSCIGKIYFLLGFHTHKSFNLIAEVHECTGVQKGKSVYVELIAGRFRAYSQAAKELNGTSEIYERLLLHIRQCDEIMEIRLYKHGIINSELLGNLYLSVKNDLVDKNLSKGCWYQLQKEGRNTPLKVNISFFKLNINVTAVKSLLFQQAVIAMQIEAEKNGKEFNLKYELMNDKESLAFLSKGLEGPLKKKNNKVDSWSDLYFKAVEIKTNKWEWCWWENQNACISGNTKKGSISFLAISLVLPCSNDRSMFFLRHHDKTTAYDVYFKKIDRDRNVWADGLYEFIDKLRSFLDKCPATSSRKQGKKSENCTQQKNQKGNKFKEMDKSSSMLRCNKNNSYSNFDDVRRMPSPVESFNKAENAAIAFDVKKFNSDTKKSL